MSETRPDRLGRATRRLGHAAAWCFALVTVITVYEVVARYGFGSPTTWVHASATTLCAIAFALGGAYAMERGEHMRVTSLTDRLPAGLRLASEWLSVLCGAVFLAGLGWGCFWFAIDSAWRFEGDAWQPEPLPGPPGWPLPALTKVTLFAGTVLFLLVLLVRAMRPATARPPDALPAGEL